MSDEPAERVEGNRMLRKHFTVSIAHQFDRPALETQIRHDNYDGFVMEGGVSNAICRGRTCAELHKSFL